MSIFIDDKSIVIVQGMTGAEGTKHTKRMLASGTKIVGGVTPGKGGQSVDIDGHALPVFNTVAEAMKATGANTSVVFVPPKFAKAAVIDAIDASMPLVVVITEGIPVHDSASFYAHAVSKGTTRIIGPNCPGLISPGKSNVGIIPADITSSGPIGLVSKSGTLTYQMMFELRDIGFSTAVGIGGDPVIGTTHIDCLRAFQDDPDTKAIVMIGEMVAMLKSVQQHLLANMSLSQLLVMLQDLLLLKEKQWGTQVQLFRDLQEQHKQRKMH
jgi:succinyl-CoA synthetase alpha subunit